MVCTKATTKRSSRLLSEASAGSRMPRKRAIKEIDKFERKHTVLWNTKGLCFGLQERFYGKHQALNPSEFSPNGVQLLGGV